MPLPRRSLIRGAIGLAGVATSTKPSTVLAQAASNSHVADLYAASSESHPVNIVNLDLVEEEAKNKLSDFAYAFISGGAGDEWTLRENRRAFSDFPIMTSRLTGVDLKSIDLRTKLLDAELPTPIIVAPMGVHGLAHQQAEVGTASGAGAAGALYQCSGASNKPMEDIARATQAPKWFQLYFNADVGVTRSLLQRAKAAGYTAVVLTADAIGPGQSDRVKRLGKAFPPGLSFGNHNLQFGGSGNFFDQKKDLTWADIDFCREVSGLPVVVKGLLRAEDAVLAVKAGAAAVQVSNHGGRQIDGVPASITVLPGIADALSGKVPIILDGGIRRGADVVRALALGATAVAVGRPVLYGLAAGGPPGVKSVLDFLTSDLKVTMLLAGVGKVSEINRSAIMAAKA
jgi:lactate oxidase